MDYPWWHVPSLTSPMLIAIIATVHVLVAHYAVGGGLFLYWEARYAYKHDRQDYLGYLKSHAWFFILLTVVFGAITGVGIWWTIGLASPLATEQLIHTFVFGWAIEYVFFVVEIVAAFLFYYFWGKLSRRTHLAIGALYAFSAWMSLVLITGITAFMLNPGDWPENPSFWNGFLNPQFIPQTLARTGGALLLASLYVYLHAAFRAEGELCDLIAKRSSRPALLGAALVVLGGIGWYLYLPESAAAALEAASALNLMALLIFGLTVVVFFMLYLGPYRNPSWLSPGFAVLLFAAGLAAFASGEFIREAVRKPYVVYNVVYSNNIYPEEVPELREKGYLEGGTWTHAWVRDNYPSAVNGEGQDGTIDESALTALPAEDRQAVGEVLYQYHCSMCHAAEQGLSATAHLVRGWDREMIRSLVEKPNQFHFFMPPWAGTDEEAELLTDYLESIAPPTPGGMRQASESE